MLKSLLLAALFAAATSAQSPGGPTPPPAAGRGPAGPVVVSPEVLPDHSVTFRILAPDVTKVALRGSDIPQLMGGGRGAPPNPGPTFLKSDKGVWETTVGPIAPGAYRYNFNVDGLTVIDPRNPATSESNANTWSLVVVPGSDFMDTKNVPHGAVASVTYYSTALGKFRRMHVYTPPGYEAGSQKYPVFYLLHGAGDSDDSWTSVGRAGFIVDNLIAANKTKPMIIVMPAGHTSQMQGMGRGAAPVAGAPPPRDEFFDDFTGDIMPYVEKNYRTINDRAHRAIAGLSMGGSQTLNVAFKHLDKFAYIGVFSSGILGGNTADWEKNHLADLDNASLKKGLKTLWFSTGADDGLITTSKSTVDLLNKHGFNATFKESPGAHTWINWRNYLNEFTPGLFQ